MAGQQDLDSLLQQSEQLVAREVVGLPRVERDLAQLASFSERLRHKARPADSSAEALAATRLLAQQGLDSRNLTAALQTFELRPAVEDVFLAEAASLEEYLAQVHEMTVITAIQEAQQDTVAAFEEYMTECREADWAADKRQLFDAALPRSVGDSATAASSLGALRSPGLLGAGTPLGAARAAGFGGQLSVGRGAELSGRAAKYAQVVSRLNEAQAAGQAFDAVAAFAAACTDEPPGERRATMQKCWQLLATMDSAARSAAGGSAGSSSARRQEGLLAGARRYLEGGHAAYLHNVIQAHRAQAALGGGPGRLAQVHAFLRIREKDRGPLDFDVPGGRDTTWERIYFCLRSGWGAEAVQVAQSAREVTAMRIGHADFAQLLQEWLDNNGKLSPSSASAVSQECQRLLRDKGSPAQQRSPSYRYRLALHALLAADKAAADTLFRDMRELFPTIEDFMWFKIAIVRPARSEGGLPASPFSPAGGEVYSLAELQHYLQQFPPSHYTHGGREPLQYVMTLLLSLQFRSAVTYLARDPDARPFRVDAVHLAIALQAAGLLDAGGPAAGRAGNVDVGKLIHSYAREFEASDPALALEYIVQAAAALGGGLAVKGALLRQLLVASRAWGFLLGAGGPAAEGSPLARFLPDRAERLRLIEAVAYECQEAAQTHEAIELLMAAERPRGALALINQLLSDALEAAQRDRAREEEVEGLTQRGAAAVAAMRAPRSPEDDAEAAAFEQLQTIRRLLQARAGGDSARVLALVGDLPWLPLAEHLAARAAQRVAALHPAVAQHLDNVVLAAAQALAGAGQAGPLRLLVNFASMLPQRIGQATYQRLSQLVNSVGAA